MRIIRVLNELPHKFELETPMTIHIKFASLQNEKKKNQ